MRAIARFRQYADLMLAIDARRRELGMTMLELDARSGLPLGYSGKLFTDPTKANAKTLGRMSLGLILQALDVEMVLVRSAAPQGTKTELDQIDNTSSVSDRMRKLGSAGGKRWVESRTREQVIRSITKARRARWDKHKAEKRQERLRAVRRAERERKAQEAAHAEA